MCVCVCTARVNSYHHPSRWRSPALPPVIDGSIDSAVPPPSFSLRLNKTVHDTIKHLSPPPLIAPRAFIAAASRGRHFYLFLFFSQPSKSFCLTVLVFFLPPVWTTRRKVEAQLVCENAENKTVTQQIQSRRSAHPPPPQLVSVAACCWQLLHSVVAQIANPINIAKRPLFFVSPPSHFAAAGRCDSGLLTAAVRWN